MAIDVPSSLITDATETNRCCVHDDHTGTSRLLHERRLALNRRVRLLVAATITYNVIEGAIAITAGTVAGSTALIGFGLDSMIEVSSAAIVAWQFSTVRIHR